MTQYVYILKVQSTGIEGHMIILFMALKILAHNHDISMT